MKQPATLTGLAVGDALGMPFETDHFSSKRLAAWDGSFQASTYHKLQPGQWTDDTQMATVLAKSLLDNQTYAPADTARRYQALFDSGKLRGAGSAVKASMSRLIARMPWIMSGVPSEGNGGAMRVAPLGLYFHNNVEAVDIFARMDAAITHNQIEALVGAQAVAMAVATLVQGRADQHNLTHRVVDWLKPSRVKERLQEVCTKLNRGYDRPDQVLKDLIEMGTGAHVVETVPAAFLAFCGTGTFKDAVVTAIQAGGDTDTVAAITGALAGSFYGTKQVDPYLFDPNNVGLEEAHRLRALESDLFNNAPPVYDTSHAPVPKG